MLIDVADALFDHTGGRRQMKTALSGRLTFNSDLHSSFVLEKSSNSDSALCMRSSGWMDQDVAAAIMLEMLSVVRYQFGSQMYLSLHILSTNIPLSASTTAD